VNKSQLEGNAASVGSQWQHRAWTICLHLSINAKH